MKVNKTKLQKALAVVCVLVLLAGTGALASDIFEAVSSGRAATQGTAPESTTAAAPVLKVGRIDASDGSMNVRTGPWGKIIGVLHNNDRIRITGVSGKWYIINFLGKSGYIHKSGVDLTAAPPPADLRSGLVTGLGAGFMNVRMGPWGTILGRINKGEQVLITGESDNWYIVDYKGTTAYIHKSGITVTGRLGGEPPPDEPPTIRSGQVFGTGDGYLNVRTDPWGTVAGTLTEGDQILITGEDGDWYIIDFKGTPAYVHKSAIKITGRLGEDGQNDKPREPNPVKLHFDRNEINARTPAFESWIRNGLNRTDQLHKMPYVENIYGKKVLPEDVVKTVIWIESRGTHTRKGKVLENRWGFTGFMQLGRHFGEGRFDPKDNIRMGIRFLNDSCLNSSTPPPDRFRGQIYNEADTPEDMLIKGMVGYNRGPYGTTAILTKSGRIKPPVVGLDRPWAEVVAKTPTSGHCYMQEGVNYGLMSKAALGLPFTAAEKRWIKKFRKLSSDEAFDKWRDKIYASVHAL